MSYKKGLAFFAAGAGLAFLLAFVFFIGPYQNTKKQIREYFKTAKEFNQSVIQNTPIYSDFANDKIEKELRTYLLMEHLSVAHNGKYSEIKNEDELKQAVKKEELVFVESGTDDPVFFYNVPAKYRYLRNFTKKGLWGLCEAFQEHLPQTLKGGNKGIQVKLAISSAVRPASYQKSLRNKNTNASFESTHSYGISFDIFYDDFYVSIDPDGETKKPGKEDANPLVNAIRKQHGFSLGNSLRRQFQTVLAKTLLDLQHQHKLYAIQEKNQKCYHVTILPDQQP